MGIQFKGPSKVDKAMIIADPAAAFMGYLSTALATFGVFDKLGMSADQVAILGGAALGMVATLRAIYEKKKRKEGTTSDNASRL